MTNENQHRSHPVRNFFFTVYSLSNIIAFLGFFYAFYAPELPNRIPILIAAGAWAALGLVLGVLRPIFRLKYKGRKEA